jgi:protein HOOK3
VKKADVLKTQLEAYRRQVQDLQLKLTEETKRGDKLEFDVKRLQEKLTVCQQDKEVCIQRTDGRVSYVFVKLVT